MGFWPGNMTPGEILDLFKERYRSGGGPPPRISRLEAACIRFDSSLLGYRRADVDEYRLAAVDALKSFESGNSRPPPESSFKRTFLGVSPRQVNEFRVRVANTLMNSS
jgi:hypothetical protein